MARLRREEESRAYHRMLNPPLSTETFSQRFPSSYPTTDPNEEDEMTYNDINRQMALIFNVLLSIIACAGAIWMAAKWWNTPARLALSMSGSLLVGVAEVVVYSGYIRRLGEAKGKAKGLKEVKEVVRTWVVGPKDEEGESEGMEGFGSHNDLEPVKVDGREDLDDSKARRRKKAF